MRWFPERPFIGVGDAGYGTSETARCCRQPHRHRTRVSTLYGDAALYEPPPPRPRSPVGRPRGKGENLAAPPEVGAHTANRPHLTVAWYGGSTRDIEGVTGTGHWDRLGADWVAGRWGYVPDCTGTPGDEDFLTTNLHLPPQRMGEGYTPRGSIATTGQEGREYLRRASPTCDGKATV